MKSPKSPLNSPKSPLDSFNVTYPVPKLPLKFGFRGASGMATSEMTSGNPGMSTASTQQSTQFTAIPHTPTAGIPAACDAKLIHTLMATPHSRPQDMKQILTAIQSQVMETSARHDGLFAEIINMQREVREELSWMRTMIIDAVGVGAQIDVSKTGSAVSSIVEGVQESKQGKKTASQRYSELINADSLRSIRNSQSPAVATRSQKVRAGILNTKVSFDLDSTLTWRRYADKLLGKKEFEMAISAALICNTLCMCFESQYYGLEVGYKLQFIDRDRPASDTWWGAEPVFKVLGLAFGIIFLLEFLVKLITWGHRYFYSKWNLLDFVCVAMFVLDTCFAELLSGFNPHMLRLVRLVRLARLVRLIRFLESLEALYVMTTAIAGLSRVLGWAIFLLTLILLTCDLFVVQLLHSTYFESVVASDMTDKQLEKHRLMYSYFGTVSRCMLSMYEITLGNWPVIARLLSEEVSQWFIILCLAHKLTIGFAVIGVITGVILQETFKVAQTDDIIMLRAKKRQSAVLRQKLESLFQALDEDHDGRIVMQEFLVICEDPDVRSWLQALDVETDDLAQLFKLIDYDKSGTVSLDELVSRLPRIRGAARSIDVMVMLEQIRRRKGVLLHEEPKASEKISSPPVSFRLQRAEDV